LSKRDSFVHLHLHTEYSMLDGASRIGDVVAAVAADGQPAVGITDHGNMYGALPMYSAAREAGLEPVIGMEGYFTKTSRFERPKRVENEIFHLTMLAETNEGYRNLIKITSAAFLDGYYYKPRSDWELLERHHHGITATSGCLGGLVPQLILNGDEKAALEAAARFQDVFGRDHFFIELQDHGSEDDRRVFKPLLDIARRLQAPLLATNDSHYTHKEDAEAHDALLCVQTGSLKSDAKRLKFEGDDFYIKSAAEMRDVFRELPDACDNTLLIAERANVEIEFGQAGAAVVPRAGGPRRELVPPGAHDAGRARALRADAAPERDRPHRARARRRQVDGILRVLPRRVGSRSLREVTRHPRRSRAGGARRDRAWPTACASSTSTRSSTTCCSSGCSIPAASRCPTSTWTSTRVTAGEMIRYAAQKYGEDHVAQVITFSTIKARAAVRDGARVLGYPYVVGDKIAKLMPPLIMGRDTPLHACFEPNEKYVDGYKMANELRQLRDDDPDARRVIDVALGLEGLRRQDGIHAAAVVITREPLTEYVPIQRKPEPGTPIEEAPMVTQYEMHGVEDLGLLKMDFLGLRNLDVMEIALDLIERSTGERPDIDDLPLDDPKTFALLQKADTMGVFQLEGGPMRALLRSLIPNTFEDVAAVIALYRPGPMAQNWHNEYADRKNGRKSVTFDHPDLEEILGPTYGLMIYQEQLMRASQKLAGYSLEEADNLRKATWEESPRAHRQGARQVRRGLCPQRPHRRVRRAVLQHDRAVRRLLVQQVAQRRLRLHHVPNRVAEGEPSRAVSRGVAHEREEQPRQAGVYLNDCRQRGIDVLVPDVNRSASDFACELAEVEGEQDAIRFGPLGVATSARGWPSSSAPGGRRPVRRLLRLLRTRRPDRAQQARDRVVDQGGRVRLPRAPAQGSVAGVRTDRRRDAAPPARA
jgi:DNA polymerase-3 subunit alpha